MFGVEEIGGGDGDDVDVRIVDDVAVVGGGLGDAEFGLVIVQTRFVHIADGGQFAVWMVAVADAMAVSHAQSDNACLVFVVLHTLFPCRIVLLTSNFECLCFFRLVSE